MEKPQRFALEYRTRRASRTVARLRRAFPTATIRYRSGRLVVQADLATHVKMAQVLDAPRAHASPAVLSRRRFTLRVANERLEAVLRAVAAQAQVHLQIAPDVPSNTLQQLVTVDLREVTLEELFSEIARQGGLQAQRQGNTIRISRP